MPRIAYLRSLETSTRLPNKLNGRPTPRYPSLDGEDPVSPVTPGSATWTLAGIRSLSVPAPKQAGSVFGATGEDQSDIPSRCA